MVAAWARVGHDRRYQLREGARHSGTWIATVGITVRVILMYHGMEHLFPRYCFYRWLGMKALLRVTKKGMRLGYNRRGPGGIVGRVGVEAGVSLCVHGSDAGREWARDEH